MYLIGYPKSGNTWASYLLAYVLNLEYDDYDAPGIHPRGEKIRKLVKGGHTHKSFKGEFGKLLKTHRRLKDFTSNDSIIYIIRNPRDVVVSYYFYLQNRGDALSWDEVIDKVAGEWEQHVQHFHNFTNSTNIYFLRYEDLKSNTSKALQMLFEEMRIKVDNEIIAEAEKLFSFSAMSGREAGKENRQSFYRKGITGDWKNHLTESQSQLILKSLAKTLRQFTYDE